MQLIPDDILAQYEDALKKRAIPVARYADYRKWLRYYLDFRSKYTLSDSKSEHVRLFIEKLQKKNQTPEQQKQAAHALSLYFEILRKMDNEIPPAQINTKKTVKATSPPPPLLKGNLPITYRGLRRQRRHISLFRICNSRSAYPKQSLLCLSRRVRLCRGMAILRHQLRDHRHGYPFLLYRLENVIMNGVAWRNPTLQIGTLSSIIWRQRSRHDTIPEKRSKPMRSGVANSRASCEISLPDELSATDVKTYLTYLAVKCKVSASTQNQAFNALLFLFRHILKKDFGDHKDIPRAKKSTYIPVVLSRKEIDAVFKHLGHPYDLAVKLLYGCGLVSSNA